MKVGFLLPYSLTFGVWVVKIYARFFTKGDSREESTF